MHRNNIECYGVSLVRQKKQLHNADRANPLCRVGGPAQCKVMARVYLLASLLAN